MTMDRGGRLVVHAHGAVIVAYNTEAARLAAVLDCLPERVSFTVVVDNSVDYEASLRIAEVVDSRRAILLDMRGNAGIASAQNAAISLLFGLGATSIAFLDDDALLTRHEVEELLRSFETIVDRGLPVAGVGPLLLDSRSRAPLAFEIRCGRILPVRLQDGSRYVRVAFLVSSGSVLSCEALRRVGFMNDRFFIDHVDMEWGLRARATGYMHLIDTSVAVMHPLGDTSATRSRSGGHHNPDRDYYLVRNGFLALRESGFGGFASRMAVGLRAASMAFHRLASIHARPSTRIAALQGLWHALLGVSGRRGWSPF